MRLLTTPKLPLVLLKEGEEVFPNYSGCQRYAIDTATELVARFHKQVSTWKVPIVIWTVVRVTGPFPGVGIGEALYLQKSETEACVQYWNNVEKRCMVHSREGALSPEQLAVLTKAVASFRKQQMFSNSEVMICTGRMAIRPREILVYTGGITHFSFVPSEALQTLFRECGCEGVYELLEGLVLEKW